MTRKKICVFTGEHLSGCLVTHNKNHRIKEVASLFALILKMNRFECSDQ